MNAGPFAGRGGVPGPGHDPGADGHLHHVVFAARLCAESGSVLCGAEIFTSIAFDSGGVASGPMTATFLLPFAMGACDALGGNVVTDAFGVVAMVAMTPLVTIQLLGVSYKRRIKQAPCGRGQVGRDHRAGIGGEMKRLYFMITITNRVVGSGRFVDFYRAFGAPVVFTALGRGTASDDVLSYLGLEATEKAVMRRW